MSARFEIVRTAAGWHARFRASNSKVQFSSENYTRRSRAVAAVANLLRSVSPTDQVWVSNTRAGGVLSSEVRYGAIGHSTYTNAHRVEVREVDERTEVTR